MVGVVAPPDAYAPEKPLWAKLIADGNHGNSFQQLRWPLFAARPHSSEDSDVFWCFEASRQEYGPVESGA